MQIMRESSEANPEPQLTLRRQKKFKKIVETCGFSLFNGVVVEADSEEAKAKAAAPRRGPRKKGPILRRQFQGSGS